LGLGISSWSWPSAADQIFRALSVSEPSLLLGAKSLLARHDGLLKHRPDMWIILISNFGSWTLPEVVLT
jgi:hypothetical protein